MLEMMQSTPADNFYAGCGIVRHAGAMEFWAELSLRLGDGVANEVGELLERRAFGGGHADDVAVFACDPERQRVTIDAASPHTWTWLNVLAGVGDLGAALDLGCGGGVATCFLAARHPGARVVGVDANQAAIETARRLAGELGLVNVEFEVAELEGLHLARSFDLVVSSAVWAETEEWVHAGRWWSALNELPRLLRPGAVRSFLAETAARHLLDDGIYLSLERCRDFAGLAAWISAQQSVGLNFDAAISDMLTIDGVLTGPERLPLVATRRDVPPVGEKELVQWRLRVGDARLDEALLTEVALSSGAPWSLVTGTLFDASEDGDNFSAALLLLERGDESKLYFASTRGVREVLASSPDGGADQFRPLYRRMRDHLGQRQSVSARRSASADDLEAILPRAPINRVGER
jgi:SAM-dependent methyltransferase